MRNEDREEEEDWGGLFVVKHYLIPVFGFLMELYCPELAL